MQQNPKIEFPKAPTKAWVSVDMRRRASPPRFSLLALTLLSLVSAAHAEQVKVRHLQGSAHGFVDVTTLEGTRIAVGDLLQRAHKGVVSSRLILHFFDGSVDDETTLFSQRDVFRLISDHHVQRGPSFPEPTDVTIDARNGLVTATDTAGKVTQAHIDMPPDVYNGLASSMLMNVLPTTPETLIAVVVPSAKPRIARLSMKNGGDVSFTMGGIARRAIDYVVHVELGGVAGVVAPLIGKEPPDYHVWILSGPDPAFIREEGPLYVGGPIWRIEQISAEFPKK